MVKTDAMNYLSPASSLVRHNDAAVKSVGLKISAESMEDLDPKALEDVRPEVEAPLIQPQLFSESLLPVRPSPVRTPPSLMLRW